MIRIEYRPWIKTHRDRDRFPRQEVHDLVETSAITKPMHGFRERATIFWCIQAFPAQGNRRVPFLKSHYKT